MSTELLCLALGGMLAAFQVILAAAPKSMAAPQWAAGPRDAPPPELPAWAQRADRARANMLETFPVFAAAALGIVALGASSWWSETAAIVWLAARALYLPAYLFHVPLVRSTIWGLSFASVLVLLILLAGAAGQGGVPAA